MARRTVQRSNEPMGLKQVKKETDRQMQLVASAEQKLEVILLENKKAEAKKIKLEGDIKELGYEKNISIKEVGCLSKDIQDSEKQLGKVNKEIITKGDSIESANTKADKIIAKAESGAKASMEFAYDAVAIIQKTADKLESDITGKNATLAELEGNISASNKEIKKSDADILSKSKMLDLLNKEIDGAELEHEELLAKVTEYRTTLFDLEKASERLEILNKDIADITKDIDKEEKKLELIMQKQSDTEVKIKAKVDEERKLMKAIDLKTKRVERMIEENKVQAFFKSRNV